MGRPNRFRIVLALFLALLAAGAGDVLAQATPPPPDPAQAPAQPLLRPEELDQLLAPIALYPDSLLAQVLMAATYPLEIVQAARWVKDNASVKGDQVVAALRDRPWDPSVKSLAQFPDVLGMLNERLEWTQKLGDAFLTQQRDVATSVQRLRKRAQDAGTLKSGQQQVVTVEKEVIIIQPASPQVVYVPSYDPVVVYGAWPYPAYPPPPPPPYYYPATGIALGFAAGFVTGAALYGGWDWHHGDITINNSVNHYHNSGNINSGNINTGNIKRGQNTWKHDPAHRKGAPYNHPATAQRYGQTRPTAAHFSGEARGYGAGAGRAAETQPALQGRSGPGREVGPRPAASPLDSGRRQLGAGGGAGGGAFGGVGAGHAESLASQRGAASHQGSFGGGQRAGGFGGGRAGGGGGRRR
jgi:hypothetical protein